MLRGNLSTRPFYNDRMVRLGLTVVALVALALTAFNVSRLMTLSAARRDVNARIARDEDEAARIRHNADTIAQSVDRQTLVKLAGSTREANSLIDQRLFSWTSFFSLIEKTLPPDMRVVSVVPSVEKGVFRVGMVVVARDYHDIDKFLDALQATGAFYDVVPSDQQLKDDGTYTAAIVSSYLSPPRPAAPPGAHP